MRKGYGNYYVSQNQLTSPMTLDERRQRWTFTSRFLAKKGQTKFLKRLEEARNFFPELESETVKVGITINVPGKADLKSKAVYFRSRNVSSYVIGHELTHLLQETGGVPKGERSCDVYTLARNVEFCDEVPNYVKVPKRLQDGDRFIKKEFRDLVHETARTALALRSSGKKRYISWFEKTLQDSLDMEDRVLGVDFGRNVGSSKKGPAQMRLDDFLGCK